MKRICAFLIAISVLACFALLAYWKGSRDSVIRGFELGLLSESRAKVAFLSEIRWKSSMGDVSAAMEMVDIEYDSAVQRYFVLKDEFGGAGVFDPGIVSDHFATISQPLELVIRKGPNGEGEESIHHGPEDVSRDMVN